MALKFRIVSATRETLARFRSHTALGRTLEAYNYPFVELRLFPSNSIGLPALYNTALREAESDPAVMIFVHDDVYLCDFYWPYHLLLELESFDILGLVGNRRRVPNQGGWSFIDDKFTMDASEHLSGIVAHGSGFPPSTVNSFGPPSHEVKLLDGLLIAAHSETLLRHQLRFDERFDFHFYDMDFCRQAEERRLRMGTSSVSAIHESTGSFGSPSWQAAYAIYLEKWKS